MNPNYHPEADGMAFNVKDYGGRQYKDGGSQGQRERAYERAQEGWWHNAELIAKRHGFYSVTRTGRSAGWLVPRDSHNAPVSVPPTDRELVALTAFGVELQTLFNLRFDMFADELDAVIEEDAAEEAAELAEEGRRNRVGQSFDALVALAQAVANCETLPRQFREQARDALALLGKIP